VIVTVGVLIATVLNVFVWLELRLNASVMVTVTEYAPEASSKSSTSDPEVWRSVYVRVTSTPPVL